MRLTFSCVANHEEQFRKAMGAKQKAEAKKELAAKKRQQVQAERRIDELDRLFKRIYEDNVSGKLSDSRFQMLSDSYEQEQEELREKLLRLDREINEQEGQAENIDRFIGKVKKYLDLDELTPAVLNDMVKAVSIRRTSQAGIGSSRLTFHMTLWEYSPCLYWKACKAEKRHSPQATPFPENNLMLFYECRPLRSLFSVSIKEPLLHR